MLIPVIDTNKNTTGILMLANSNDSLGAMHESENEKFKGYFCTYLISLYFDTAEKRRTIDELKVKRSEMSATYSKMLNYCQVWQLFEFIEGPLCEVFKVHRINFLLCDHMKNELYKIVRDGKTHKQRIISYDNVKGLAKAVANDGMPIVANNAQATVKFLAIVDDPLGVHATEKNSSDIPVSILSVPVYRYKENSLNSNCLGKFYILSQIK